MKKKDFIKPSDQNNNKKNFIIVLLIVCVSVFIILLVSTSLFKPKNIQNLNNLNQEKKQLYLSNVNVEVENPSLVEKSLFLNTLNNIYGFFGFLFGNSPSEYQYPMENPSPTATGSVTPSESPKETPTETATVVPTEIPLEPTPTETPVLSVCGNGIKEESYVDPLLSEQCDNGGVCQDSIPIPDTSDSCPGLSPDYSGSTSCSFITFSSSECPLGTSCVMKKPGCKDNCKCDDTKKSFVGCVEGDTSIYEFEFWYEYDSETKTCKLKKQKKEPEVVYQSFKLGPCQKCVDNIPKNKGSGALCSVKDDEGDNKAGTCIQLCPNTDPICLPYYLLGTGAVPITCDLPAAS
jgi:hypothetical protein